MVQMHVTTSVDSGNRMIGSFTSKEGGVASLMKNVVLVRKVHSVPLSPSMLTSLENGHFRMIQILIQLFTNGTKFSFLTAGNLKELLLP